MENRRMDRISYPILMHAGIGWVKGHAARCRQSSHYWQFGSRVGYPFVAIRIPWWTRNLERCDFSLDN